MDVVLKNVTKKIKEVTVIDDISLHFASGRIYGLKGKNGSGKTMLMRLICGLILPTEGTIHIDGLLLGKDMSFPKDTGILIENPSFISKYTGYKNLNILASLQANISESDVKKVLADIGLDPEDKRTYKKYSLGMKQRLGIASAMMGDPKLILLDEPINALDENGVLLVRNLLDNAKKRGAIVIVACHDREELELLSDEIYCLSHGKIIDAAKWELDYET